MGAGKTTIGRRLADLLGWEFVDSDREIEARTGADIPLIFDIEGEAGFRRREKEVIAGLMDREGMVLATGGGAILDPDTRRLLRDRARVVYLKASPEQSLARTARDRRRPLLQTEDPKGRLEALLAERDPLYRETAHLVVDTGGRGIHSVANEILRRTGLRRVGGPR